MEKMELDVRTVVRDRYSKIAESFEPGQQADCGCQTETSCCGGDDDEQMAVVEKYLLDSQNNSQNPAFSLQSSPKLGDMHPYHKRFDLFLNVSLDEKIYGIYEKNAGIAAENKQPEGEAQEQSSKNE